MTNQFLHANLVLLLLWTTSVDAKMLTRFFSKAYWVSQNTLAWGMSEPLTSKYCSGNALPTENPIRTRDGCWKRCNKHWNKLFLFAKQEPSCSFFSLPIDPPIPMWLVMKFSFVAHSISSIVSKKSSEKFVTFWLNKNSLFSNIPPMKISKQMP